MHILKNKIKLVANKMTKLTKMSIIIELIVLASLKCFLLLDE